MERTLTLKFDTRLLVVLGALLVMVAVALPWSSLPAFVVGDLARSGIAGGGLLTLALALLVVVSLFIPRYWLDRVSLPAFILAVLIYLVAISALIRIIQLAGILELELGAQLGSLGSGLYLTFAGAALIMFGGLSRITPAADDEDPDSPLAQVLYERPWLGYAGWVALGAALVAACFCAWGIALLTRPVTLAASGSTPTPTFAPVPTEYLATPLIDVQLAPLGGVTSESQPPSIAATETLPFASTLPTPTPAPALPPTLPPTATQRPPTAPPPPSPTLPVLNVPTATMSPTSTPTSPSSPLGTPTHTATPTRTPTATGTPH